MISPTPYTELNQVLDELVSRVAAILEDDLVGAYLQGSFALGDYDRHSDVDFIVVTKYDLRSQQVDALQVMHDRVYQLDCAWAQHLEGSYIPQDVLRHVSERDKELWYLDHGARSLVRSDHCNTLIVRWVVREEGVTLAGPPPSTLVEPITPKQLRAEIFKTLTTWGREILDDPAPYENHFYQAFIVLNYCRMLHDLHAGRPGSKRDGADWAKTNLRRRWSDLIDNAWTGRPNPAQKVQEPADPDTFARTLAFVDHVMAQSKQYMKRRQQRKTASAQSPGWE